MLTALTVDNVLKAVEEVEWSTLCKHILRVPDSTVQVIVRECSTDNEQKLSGVKWWVANDPLASWRRLTQELYTCEETVGDKIRNFCEDVAGMCVHYTIR